MDAHEYLSQIAKLDLMIRHKIEQVERWRDAAHGLGGLGGSGERVQTSAGVYGRVPDAVCRYVDLEREIDELRLKRAAIIRCIEQLPSVEYEIIYAIYVEGATIQEVAYRLKKSYEFVKIHKKKALGMVRVLIDGENKA